MKADVAQFKEEMTKAHEKRKATLKAKIEQLEGRIDAQVKKVKADHEAFKLRQQAKRELLKKNAAAAGKALKELARTPL
jgi:predicted metalloenzyme YecM